MLRTPVQSALAYPVVVLLLLWPARPASAQAVVEEPGSTGGIFGGHRPLNPDFTSQRFSFNVDLSSGYDDTDDPFNAGSTPVGGYAGTVGTTLRYWRGRERRFFSVSASSFVNRQEIDPKEFFGGTGLAQGGLSVGRRGRLDAAGSVAFDA
jgi:hypothetical protein